MILLRWWLCYAFAFSSMVVVVADDKSAETSFDSGEALSVASEPVTPDSLATPRVVMQIDTLLVDDMTLNDTLDVIIEAMGVEVAGCQLKIAVDGSQVDILDILPGELIDSCRWDMFDARELERSEKGAGPREIWQIVTLAQSASKQKSPVCFGFDRPASLARLVVSSAHLPGVSDTSAAIFFYWESCRDNVISDRQGASLLISDTVVDQVPVAFDSPIDQFPTRFGSLDECVSPRAADPPRRLAAFYNGGVVFRLAVDTTDPDSASLKQNHLD